MFEDWRSLLEVSRKQLGVSPWLVPGLLVVAIGSLFVCNPLRWEMLNSLVNEPRAYVPLQNMSVIPSDFARLIWSAIVLSGIVWFVRNKRGLRISIYALLLLVLLAGFGLSLWVAAIQVWIAIKWPSDLLRGFVALGFAFAYFWACLLGAKRWRAGVAARCPVCLKRLRFPLNRGRNYDVLVHPRERESICFEGHGTLVENRWESTFQPSAGFWRDLAKLSGE